MENIRKIIRNILKEGILDDGNPDRSWLAGKFSWKIDGGRNTIEAEINTKLPYLAIGKFFAQGEEADNFIDEIHQIWLKNNCSPKKAIQIWAGHYLSPEDI